MANESADGLLTDERLRTALGERPFRLFDEIGSTNDVARDWAEQGAVSGSVVVSEVQTSGRGRFDRAWYAPPGTALLFSAILRPKLLSPLHLARVTMLGAVSVAEVYSSYAPAQVTIKWPNDVLIHGKKAAGVLPEASWQGDRAEFVVVGAGMNIRVNFSDTSLQTTAISLEPVVRRTINRAALLDAVLTRFDHWIDLLHSDQLWQAWRNRLDTLGQTVTAITAHGEISGEAVDVDPDGALIIRDALDAQHRVTAGEVTLKK